MPDGATRISVAPGLALPPPPPPPPPPAEGEGVRRPVGAAVGNVGAAAHRRAEARETRDEADA